MTMKLDLKELQEIYNKREIAKIPGFMYAEFVEEIVVLRLANVSYRIISERLNAKVKSRKMKFYDSISTNRPMADVVTA